MSGVKPMSLDVVASQDFLSYATEVIKDRAIPNLEDNLKPVHRRILYTLYKTKLISTAKQKKSAATVGETMKIHPHGDASIYDAMVRLGQAWKMRYPLVDIQGNAGNINGASAAASRYTEAKLSPIGDLMVEEMSYNSVEMMPTYDGDAMEPMLLPSLFPNILCNGNMGIAVGMSSSILPHNLKEVVDVIIAYIKDNNITIEQILKIMPGPDLPTGGVITNIDKINEVYGSGKGTLEVQGKYRVEDKNKEKHIVFTEIPYMVNIDDIVAKVKTLYNDGEIDDVIDIQNNTGRSGIELRIILKPKSNLNRTLQILLNKTGLKNNIRVGLTVLKNKKPIQANIKDLIAGYVDHRSQVIINIYTQKKQKAEDRLHIVEGMIIATQDIDGVVDLIKSSNSRDAAKMGLIGKYNLTERQANAILDMKLSQLTKIDAYKLSKEAEDLKLDIEKYHSIINDKSVRDAIICEQLKELKTKFGDDRRTLLKSVNEDEESQKEIEAFDYLVGLHGGHLSVYDASSVGSMTKGKIGKKIFSETPIQTIQITNKNKLGIITKDGLITMIPASKLFASEHIAFLELDSRIKDDVTYIFEVDETKYNKEFIITVTKNGLIKKSSVKDYNNFKSLIYAAKIKDGDQIVFADFANDGDNVIFKNKTRILKYPVKLVPTTGRSTQGVKGYDMDEQPSVEIAKEEDKLLFYDNDGGARIVIVKDIPSGSRATKGIVIDDKSTFLVHFSRTNVILIGADNKGYALDLSTTESKSLKTVNNIIYGGKLSKIAI